MQMKNPPHPGVLIKEEIDALGISVAELALRIGVSRQMLFRIIKGQAGITAEMSLKLAKAFKTSPEFWVNMQTQYDLAQAKLKINTDNIQAYG